MLLRACSLVCVHSGFLMDRMINVTNGPSEDRELRTGEFWSSLCYALNRIPTDAPPPSFACFLPRSAGKAMFSFFGLRPACDLILLEVV